MENHDLKQTIQDIITSKTDGIEKNLALQAGYFKDLTTALEEIRDLSGIKVSRIPTH